MATNHPLGFGHGGFTDRGDGVVEYRATGKILPAFSVNVADVTGFATRKPTKQDKKNGAGAFQVIFVVLGGGTEVASVPVNAQTPAKMEAWFRSHPHFRGNAPQAAPTAQPSAAADIADQLAKLVQLRDTGAISDEDFEAAKTKLIHG